MIKDIFFSFKENFQEKVTNPFLATYIIVWLIRNWELVFTVLNFDADYKLQQKIDFINNYYTDHEFLWGLFYNILWTFLLLIVTYLLLNLSRLIVNISEKKLTPYIYKITDSSAIVLKTTYENLRTDRDFLQNRLEQERESNSRLENKIKSLEDLITEMNQAHAERNLDEVSNKSESEIEFIVNKLEEKDLLKAYISTAKEINKGESFPKNDDTIDFLVEMGLLTFRSGGTYNNNYRLTGLGEEVLRRVRIKL